MAGLKIRICFWHLDPEIRKEVLSTLKEGKLDVFTYQAQAFEEH